MPLQPTSRRFTDGQQLTPRRLESVRRDAHRTAADYAQNFRAPRAAFSSRLPSPIDFFPGVVRSAPPSGSGSGSGSDYTDARYWVDRAVPDQALGVGDLFDATVEDIPNLAETVTATNLAELPADGSDGTHTVPPGTTVQVFRFRTRETDGGAGVDQYVFTFGGVELNVLLSQDGTDSNGYPLYAMSRLDGTPIATQVPLKTQRPIAGDIPATAARRGRAVFVAGSTGNGTPASVTGSGSGSSGSSSGGVVQPYELWEADEVYGTVDACAGEASSGSGSGS